MKKLLITGASGFLGWHLCHLARQIWQVYGTYHTHAIEIPGTSLLPIDLTDFSALSDFFQTLKPDAVIHTAALSQPNLCQAHPEASHQINVVASCNLATLCAEANIPCVFTSSELVFNGSNPPYCETDPVCPINLYGEQKVAAELGMLQRYPDVTIARMPLMFGAAPAPSFIQPFIERIKTGQTLNLFVDEVRTPISGRSAAQGLLLVLEKAKGQIHLGGLERLSRYEFGLLLIEVLRLQNAKIKPCYQSDVPMAAARALDVSMDSSLAFSLGYQPGFVKDELQAIVNQF